MCEGARFGKKAQLAVCQSGSLALTHPGVSDDQHGREGLQVGQVPDADLRGTRRRPEEEQCERASRRVQQFFSCGIGWLAIEGGCVELWEGEAAENTIIIGAFGKRSSRSTRAP